MHYVTRVILISSLSSTQSVVSSSVGDVSIDPVDSTAGALRGGGHWMYREEQDSSQRDKSCRHEVVVEMEALPVPPGGVVSPGRSAVDRDVAKFGSGQGNSGVKHVERVCEEKWDFENCGILAFMSSANSIASGEEKEQATKDEDDDVENCGTLAFMTSANSVVSSGVPTGVQITGGDGGERSVIVCGNDSPAVPDTTPRTGPTGTVLVYATSNEGDNVRVDGGVEPSMSTENTDLRERGYEMMIKSGNTVGIRALKQLSSFAHQRSSAPENKTEDTPTPIFHRFSYPLGHQSHLVQQLRPARHAVWDYLPPLVKRSLVGQQACLPQTLPDNSGHDSLTSLASAPTLV